MTGIHWPWVEVAARLLERGEREAVLGDLLAGCGKTKAQLKMLPRLRDFIAFL